MTKKPSALASAAIAALLATTTLTREARADGEAWVWFEYRLPVVAPQGGPARWPRVDVRLLTDVRFNGRSGGLANSFFRAGPVVYVTPWLFIAAHGTVIANRQAASATTGVAPYQMEARAELEPNFFFRAGPLTFNDRNRVEYRWRSNAAASVRYRNQLRVNYQPLGARFFPFVWDELLIDSNEGVHQNRAFAGAAVMLTNHIRLEAGYMFRSRRDAATGNWDHDHIGVVYLFVDVPPPPPPPPVPPPPVPPPPALATPPDALPPSSTSATPELRSNTEPASSPQPQQPAVIPPLGAPTSEVNAPSR